MEEEEQIQTIVEIDRLNREMGYTQEWLALITDSVYFHLAMQWAAFGFVLAVTGTALYVLARSWFNRTINKRMAELRKELKSEILPRLKELEDNSVTMNQNKDGVYYRWNNGLQVCFSEIYLKYVNEQELSATWGLPIAFKSGFVSGVTINDDYELQTRKRDITHQTEVAFVRVKMVQGRGQPFEIQSKAKATIYAIGRWK